MNSNDVNRVFSQYAIFLLFYLIYNQVPIISVVSQVKRIILNNTEGF